MPDHKNQSPNIKEEIYIEATLELKRIALYSIAKINVGTVGGPAWMARYIPNTNMFITNYLKDDNLYGSWAGSDRLYYGRGFKWNTQPFLNTDMHIIFGPEDDISNLTSYERIKEIMYYDSL